MLLLLLRACCCTASTVLGAVHIIAGQIEETCVGYIMAHSQCGTHMRDDAIQLIYMQFITIAQFTALGTETGQRKRCGYIGTDFLHAT